MNRLLKSTAVPLLGVAGALGIPRAAHRIWFRDKLAILMYHAVVRNPPDGVKSGFVSESSFREQIHYLKKHFDVLPLAEAVEKMYRQELKNPTVAITFDDGFQNNYDVVFPILRDAGLCATIFLTSGLIGTAKTFWYLQLNEAVMRTRKDAIDWNGSKYVFNDLASRMSSEEALRAALKRLPYATLMEQWRLVLQKLGADPDAPVDIGSPFRMLSFDAVREMARSSVISFGAHTHTHRRMATLSLRECTQEVKESIAIVEHVTGRPCEVFAYPFGSRHDYNASAVKVVADCGIRYAVTATSGFNDIRALPLELRRYGVSPTTSMPIFKFQVHRVLASGAFKFRSEINEVRQ